MEKINLSEKSILFPYPKMNEDQKSIYKSIMKIDDKIIIEAGTGIGKTVVSLVSMLERRNENQKIVVFTKTINQLNPYLREWSRIVNHLNEIQLEFNLNSFLLLPLLGKGNFKHLKNKLDKKNKIYCIEEGHKRFKRALPKLQKYNHRKRFLKLINSKLLEEPTISSFIEIMENYDNCPYYNSLSLLKDADIIITTYGYLQEDKFFQLLKLSNLSINDLLVLIDEAHNLAFPVSKTLDLNKLVKFNFIFGFSNVFAKLSNLMKGGKLYKKEEIINLIDEKQIKTISKNLIKLKKEFKMAKKEISTKNDPYQLIDEIFQFLTLLIKRDLIITKNNMTSIEFYPDRYLKRLDECYLLILQSATFTPKELFLKYYNLSKSIPFLSLTNRDLRILINKKKEFRAMYVSSISSVALYRNSNLYDRYAKLIIKLFRVSPNHVLVLTPSYDFSTNLKEQIEYLTQEQITIITEKAQTKSKVLYENIMRSTNKSLIIGNQKGKILEGNEWVVNNQSIVSMVIFAGLSMSIPGIEQEVIMKNQAELLQDNNLTKLIQYQIPLFISAKQALGRIIRNKNDFGSLIILDDRADEYLSRGLGLNRFYRIQNLIDSLNKFYRFDNSIN